MVLILYFILSNGIKVKNISIQDYNISKLYIKLDKKLILNIKSIKLNNKDKYKVDKMKYIENMYQYIKTINNYLVYFESINIEKIIFNKKTTYLNFKNKIINIKNSRMNLKFTLNSLDKEIFINIKSYLKKYDLNISSELIFKDANNIVITSKYNKIDLSSLVDIKIGNKFIDFNITTNEVNNIEFIKDLIRFNDSIEDYMYKNISGIYKLNYLSGRFLKKTFKPLLETFSSNITIKNAKIKFNKNLEPIQTDLMNINFLKDTLYFNLNNPKYKYININKSNVIINNITKNNSNMDINIFTKSKLNKDILEILNQYDIYLNTIQKNGTTNSKLKLNIDLKTNEIKSIGNFISTDSIFQFNDVNIKTDCLNVTLNNNIIKINNSDIKYKNILNSIININIDTNLSKANGKIYLKKIKIENKDYSFFRLFNDNISLKIDFQDNLKLYLKKFDTLININKNISTIDILNIKKIVGYSDILKDLNISEGNISILLNNKNDIKIYSSLYNIDIPLSKNGNKITNISLEANFYNDNLNIKGLEDNLDINIYKNETLELNIKNYDILYNINENKSYKSKYKYVKLYGENSNIIINDYYKMISNNYNLDININKTIFNSIYKNGILKIYQNEHNYTKVEGYNLKSEFINNLFNKNLLKGGIVNIDASFYDNKLYGDIYLKNNKIKDLLLLNNLILFINSSPALINPLLIIPNTIDLILDSNLASINGYYIKNGSIKFFHDLYTKILNIKEINTQGINMDFNGDAKINFNKNIIKSKLKLSFFKSYANIISYIPILNYIFLDKDNKVSTTIDISGDIDNPIYNTNIIQDILLLPVNLIKRTIMYPNFLYNNIYENSTNIID